MLDPVVDVRGLAKTYEGREVVREVTICVRPGDLLGLVGANGGGKTTTLRMLAGLIAPDAGTGFVLGQSVRSGKVDRRRIGYMNQRLALYPELTITENLRFHARMHGLPAKAVHETLARFGLGEIASRRFAHLSGGWARRAQFAASVIHAPDLVLLDEPTAGLDIVTRLALWEWIAQIATAGSAVIVSTHDLTEAERLPQIMLYRDGLAGAQTTPAALIVAAGTQTLEAAILAQASQ